MNIIILYAGTEVLGGMETLILRCSRFLKERGHNVTCIIKNARPIRDLLQNLHVIEAGGLYKRLINPLIVSRFLRRHRLERVGMVLALDQRSALIAPLIANSNQASGCVAFASNWVPNYFVLQDLKPWHPMSLIQNWNLRLNYCPSTTLFMTREYIDQGRKLLGNDWSASLFPVPIEFAKFRQIERKPIPGRIVSIGRLSPMKEYNLYMIDIVEELLKKGHDFTWDVYGSGEFEDEMHARIEKKGLAERIRMHGKIAYDECPAILSQAMLFVGMGTAMLEASAAGVPGVVAIAHDTLGQTHGPIHRFSYGNVGEIEQAKPLVSVAGELDRLLNMSPHEYENESRAVQAAAEHYDENVVMGLLLDATRKNPTRRTGFYSYASTLALYDFVRSLAGLWWNPSDKKESFDKVAKVGPEAPSHEKTTLLQ